MSLCGGNKLAYIYVCVCECLGAEITLVSRPYISLVKEKMNCQKDETKLME